MLSGLDVVGQVAQAHLFVEIRLELPHPVTDEAEGVFEGHPLDVAGIGVEVVTQAVEFGEYLLGLHGDSFRGHGGVRIAALDRRAQHGATARPPRNKRDRYIYFRRDLLRKPLGRRDIKCTCPVCWTRGCRQSATLSR